ncbi:MAG: class I SAM-dependent methyltransferase [Eubacteriales bacterium]|jgi:hypothetical protein|nr:class I SAM-dependent methyltransferase [Eubacteriales bacterium]
MIDLLAMHKHFLGAHMKKGGTAVDFTMGNGHDTLYLCESVGDEGHVYAFDIQEQAIVNTEKLLRDSGCPLNWTLIHDSHANVLNYINQPICAGIFNLGWLPGADRQVTTRRESTAAAVEAALGLLDSDGILLIAVYPGHEEGRLEGEMLEARLSKVSRYDMSVSKLQIINSPLSPYFYAAERK